MSTFDEIVKEKKRIGEALARVDVQREKLTSQLSELEATERVLARYSKGPRATRTAAAKSRTVESAVPAPPVVEGKRDQIRGNWKQFVGKAKERWGRLTGDDWALVEGKRDQLVGKVHERYRITRKEAERQLSEFERGQGSADIVSHSDYRPPGKK